MIFNSIDFLLFAILFFVLWPICRKRDTSRWTLIVTASFIFYAWWDWRFLVLIISSGLVDYLCGLGIKKWKRFKRTLLILSLTFNLGALAVFKYSVFIASLLGQTAAQIGITINLVDRIPEFALILPVGISFYTFQSLSYTIDVYKDRLTPTKNLLHFFAYLSMFPQLVAGPIVRARDFLMQLNTYKKPNSQAIWHGTKLIVYGLFQKMVIADNLSSLIDSPYQGISQFDGSLYWWMVIFAFSFQIYCDFSGYSLIARGLAKLMGYHFKMNFDHPYLSSNFQAFWNRWHISLSSWFRDYVYIPLGGSKKGEIIGILALIFTFLLSGLWHGANYTFLVWASLHAFFLLIERFLRRAISIKIPQLFTIPLVFIITSISWVYFRSENLSQANSIVLKLLSCAASNPEFWETYKNNIFFLKTAMMIEFSIMLSREFPVLKRWYSKFNLDIITTTTSLIAVIFLRGSGQQFIYFQF
jgi:alginate O-acetyltransferase complex protein AlgI